MANFLDQFARTKFKEYRTKVAPMIAKHGGLWLTVWIITVAASICFATVATTLRDGPF
jgi:hypothetical protein